MKVQLTVVGEVIYKAEHEINAEEFEKWSGGEPPNPENVKDFLRFGDDVEEILESVAARGQRDSEVHYLDLDKVAL